MVTESVRQNRDTTVRFRPRDSPGAMFARNKTTLPISRIAVAIVRGQPEYAHVFAGPPQYPVIWDIAPKQKIPVSEVNRPFRPKTPLVKTLNPSIR
jgi:hypothetical protein